MEKIKVYLQYPWKFPDSPYYRYLIDKGIMMSVEIDGDYETSDFINRIYKDAEITPIEYFPNNLKIFSVDIETSSDGKKLYSIAIYSEKFEKVLMTDEEEMLDEFKKIILEEDPDIITGWNLIDFDLVFLKNKFKEYKIPFVLGRTNEPCKIKIESDFFRDSKADFPGRVVLDGIQLLRMSFVSLNSFKLEDAAQAILQEGKLVSIFGFFKFFIEFVFNVNFAFFEICISHLERIFSYNSYFTSCFCF